MSDAPIEMTLILLTRGGIIALAGFISLMVISRAPTKWVSWSILATCIGISSYALVSLPSANGPFQGPFASLQIIACLCPIFLLWAVFEIFEHEPWPRLLLVPACLISISLNLTITDFALYTKIQSLIAVACHSAVLVIAIAGHSSDLVEPRRRLRTAIVAFGGLIGLALSLTDLFSVTSLMPMWLHLTKSIAVLVAFAAFGFWLFDLVPTVLGTEEELETKRKNNALTPPERAVLARLEAAMHAGIWQTEGLTIGALAKKLDTGEHRLRRVINQGLGHRNFAQFVNGYRIDAVCEMLSNPALADRTVLQLAHQVGFASLGPFNRAFRAQTGLNPSEYKTGIDSENLPLKPSNAI